MCWAISVSYTHLENLDFYAGDMKEVLTDSFIAEHGKPEVLITDPPRAGMHPDVVQTILRAAPQRIVSVSYTHLDVYKRQEHDLLHDLLPAQPFGST